MPNNIIIGGITSRRQLVLGLGRHPLLTMYHHNFGETLAVHRRAYNNIRCADPGLVCCTNEKNDSSKRKQATSSEARGIYTYYVRIFDATAAQRHAMCIYIQYTPYMSREVLTSIKTKRTIALPFCVEDVVTMST